MDAPEYYDTLDPWAQNMSDIVQRIVGRAGWTLEASYYQIRYGDGNPDRRRVYFDMTKGEEYWWCYQWKGTDDEDVKKWYTMHVVGYPTLPDR